MDITDKAEGEGVLGRFSSQLHIQLQKDVLSGKYAPGQFLPTERKLSAKHRVAQSTVRRALKKLAAERLIIAESRQGYRGLSRVHDPLRGCPLAFLSWQTEPAGSWDPFDEHLLSELTAAASARGWALLARAAGNLSPDEVLEQRASARAFGVALSSLDERVIEAVRKSGLPAMMLDQWVEGAGIDSMMQDGHQGGVIAARYLAEHGCRRIAWFGASPLDRNAHTLARFGGASAGLAGEGCALTPDLIVGALDGSALEAARALLRTPRRPDGVIALWHRYALAIKQAAAELGLALGRDLQGVGWSPEETYESQYRPAFGTGHVPATLTWSIRTMAQTAVARMAERRENPLLPALSVKIPVQLRPAILA